MVVLRAGLGTRETPSPYRITQGDGTGIPSSGPITLHWSESRLETSGPRRVVWEPVGELRQPRALHRALGMLVSLPFLLQVSPPHDPSAWYSLGTL